MNTIELFGGISAPGEALKRLDIHNTTIAYVEWDKFAVKSYNAINGTSYEPIDINDFNSKDIYDKVELLVHGSPCQSFSIAGKQEGGDEGSGTQSSLLYKSIEVIIDTHPRVVVWENVKNVLSKKHRHNFDNYLETLEDLGYTNYWKVLNAKDFGVPQNRERVFCVSILGEHEPYVFPEGKPLDKTLADVLEDAVDDKYYLNATYQDRFNKSKPISSTDIKIIGTTVNPEANGTNCRHWVHSTDGIVGALSATDYKQPKQIKMLGLLDIKGNEQVRRVYGADGISPCLNTMQGGNRQPKIVAQRGRYNEDGGIEQQLEPRKDDITNTITTVQKDNLVHEKSSIRKLTPRECWRLMGFSDEAFNKAQEVNSNSQLYKQAGNSIVVPVLESIFANIFK